MSDLASRVEKRVREEWPGEQYVALRGQSNIPPIREGGLTDALIKLMAEIIRDEENNG